MPKDFTIRIPNGAPLKATAASTATLLQAASTLGQGSLRFTASGRQVLVTADTSFNALPLQLDWQPAAVGAQQQAATAAAAQPPQAPADAAPTSKLELLVSQIPDATAAKVAAALPRPMVQVTASGCNSGTAQDVLNMLNYIIKVEAGCLVPCCLKDVLQPLKSNIPRFSWPVHGKENAQDTVSAAVKYLKTNVLPEGTFIWPVQGLNWLTTVVDCGPPGYLCIVNSQTDYIVFMEGSDSQILKLVEGLSKVSGGLKQNLLPLVPWMVALVEAKTPTQLTQRNHVCRCQALLQYVALNHHLSASTAPMAVLLTDFNSYHTVHSGGTAKTYFDNKEMKCIHITSPAGMTSVPETKPAHASSTSHARSAAAAPSAGQPAATALAPASADLTTIQFVQTVLVQGLKARQSETAGLPLPIQDGLVSVVHERDQPGDDDDDGGGGGGGRGGGNDMEDSSQNDMEGGSQGDHDMHDGAVGDVGGDGVAGYPRTQQAHGSLQLNLEVNTFTISRKGGSKDHQDAAAHSNDESNSSDVSGSVDEALLEAAEDNIKAQQVMALLRHPAVYHGLGLTQAPRSYTPLSKEEFWGSCRLLPISDD